MASEGFVHPDGGYGWIIIAACTLINSSIQPLMQCFALIFESTFQRLKIKAAQISFLLHLHSSIMCSFGFLSAPMFKKYSYRQLAFVANVLICSGILLTSFIHTYTSLIVTVCILIGIGQGILLPSISLATNSYFKKKLTLALSYSITGVGILPIFAPTICNILLNIYGTSGTILLIAGFSLHAFIGTLLLRPFRIINNNNTTNKESPEKDAQDSAEDEEVFMLNDETPDVQVVVVKPCDEEKQEYDSKVRKKLEKISNLFDLGLFKDKQFVTIVMGMGISYTAELNFILMIPFVLYEIAKFERADVALAMSIQSAFDIAGRLTIPILAHKGGWHPRIMYAITLVGGSVGRTLLAIFCDKRNIVLACSALWGFSKGGKAVFQSLILPKYVPYEKLATAFGVLMVINGSLSLIIGPFIGWIHDISQSYTTPLHVTTMLSLSCLLMWTFTYFFFEKNENIQEFTQTTKCDQNDVNCDRKP